MIRGYIRPYYLFWGDEPYLTTRALQKLMAAVLPSQLKDLNYQSYYAEETQPQEVLNACNTLPCMAPRRVILVKNFHKYGPKEQETFVPYVASPSATTTLILLSDDTPATFLKGVKSGVFHLQRPPEGAIPQWIDRIAKEFSKQVSPEAVEHLSQALGTDLQAIQNELFKVSLYVGDTAQIEMPPGN